VKYDVVIIGGGSTGSATFRDLSMRGLEVALLERDKIASGTTSASHQNLVGGLRYVTKDPIVAKECASENKIISRIAPEIVGEITNYFVGVRNDYTYEALKSAKKIGIRVDEIGIEKALKEIHALSRKLEIVIETDDKNIDTEKFCFYNCLSAKQNGGDSFENIKVDKIEGGKNKYLILTNKGRFESKYIVNAAGAWINSVAKMVGVTIPLLYSQGTIIVQKTLSPRGLQYFHVPSDGDAYIVHDGYGWLGTTSSTINSPEEAKPEPWAERYLKKRFSVVLPDVIRQKALKKFTGIRTLFKSENKENGRQLSRNFEIIEKPENFLNIVGGKLTIARLMAEKLSDLVCEKEGINSRCRTQDEYLIR